MECKGWYKMKCSKRKCVLMIGIFLSAITVIVITYIGLICFPSLLAFSRHETTDIADYGEYTGNHDNKAVREFINSFFPEEISPDFENPKYLYRAQKFDTYAFEAYLEFTISDENTFQKYMTNVTNNTPMEVFQYEQDFVEYVIADELTVSIPPSEQEKEKPDYYSIQYAKIGKILFNDDNNTIIYIALGVYDGGGVFTDYLREYFTKFHIDPAQYGEVIGRQTNY